ncbi:hypothetical protein P154DRAFT_416562, partial [Amniculicola lignicola CBS 123094]
FAPGLFEILQSATPPTIAWILSLSDEIPINSWGVYYCLVFEKKGYPTLVQIGCSTNNYRGLRARIYSHRDRQAIPTLISAAYEDTYHLSEVRVLCFCPIPSAGNFHTVRALVIALESVFSCLFWAMRKTDVGYGFGNMCPFSKDDFEYAGLCGHNSLLDPIQYLELSPQQREENATIIQDKNKAYMKDYGRKKRADPTPQYKASYTLQNRKQRLATKRRQQKAVEDQTYRCDICDVKARDKSVLRLHNLSPRHMEVLERGKGDWHCDPCKRSFTAKSYFTSHTKFKGH